MSRSESAPRSDELILARFVSDLEARGNPVVEEYAGRYPELADELRRMAAMNQALGLAPPEAGPPIPARLGEFRVVRRIARGGMGEIYEAVQDRLDRRVAVKTIRRGKISPDARERFLREQTVLARLHQTHIVPIHTAGEEGPLQYFAMPYIDGAALHHVVRAAYEMGTTRGSSKTPSLARLAGMIASDSQHRAAHDRAPDGANPNGDQAGAATTEDLPLRLLAPRDARWPPPNADPPDADRAQSEPLKLSAEYFRSVAEVMADAAEALQHAHDVNILHRDLKPSNIMVDTSGQCWLIDFGLAGFVKGAPPDAPKVAATLPVPSPHKVAGTLRVPSLSSQEPAPAAPLSLPSASVAGTLRVPSASVAGTLRVPSALPDGELTADGIAQQPAANSTHDVAAASGLLGTLHYMAPEQFDSRADARTDVWGLGVTMYELLTLRRAFGESAPDDVRQHILAADPHRPRDLVRNLPPDLAAICLRALNKNPDRRYQRAGDFAADLRRWQRGEPTEAKPAWAPKRLYLWSRRNKGWATAITAVLLTIIALGVGGIQYGRNRQRELMLQGLQRARLGVHEAGWSGKALQLARNIAEIRPGADLRNDVAATLMGMDATLLEMRENFGATSLAFDRQGKRLLLGGAWPVEGRPADPARLWDIAAGSMVVSQLAGVGPVGFRDDGTPLQVVPHPDDRCRLLLHDLAEQRQVREFRIDGNAPPQPVTELNAPAMALAPDCSKLAASAAWSSANDEVAKLAVWNLETGVLQHEFDGVWTAIAFSLDASLLAAGDQSGRISVWSLASGRNVAQFQAGRAKIHCLAFARDPLQPHGQEREGSGWILAAGDADGTATIWDVAAAMPRIYCRGSEFGLYSVAFSPDAALLLTSGRIQARLWNTASGEVVLRFKYRNEMPGAAFSPDGRRVAISSLPIFGNTAGVDLWRLHPGRGIQTLHGLIAPIVKVRFSPDERLVAALSHDWRVAVWQRDTGHLRFVLDVPKGDYADNAALAFSPDGKRFAFSAGSDATLCDAASGKQLNSWKLPSGISDTMAFDAAGEKLLLLRVEAMQGDLRPFVSSDATTHRACRIRDLLAPASAQLIAEITGFNKYVYPPLGAPDGTYLLIEGRHEGPAGIRRFIKGFNGLTGKEIWSREVRKTANNYARLASSADGMLAAVQFRDGDGVELVHVPSGEVRGSLGVIPNCLSSDGRYSIGGSVTPPTGIPLFRGDTTRPLISLGIDRQCTSGAGPLGTHFSRDGLLVVWGNTDASVNVCDLPEVHRRLSELGLGW